MNLNKTVISECNQYRYLLVREADLFGRSEEGLLFLMLNPSTADAREDDATITKCTSFSKAFGFNGYKVVNLYGFRSTRPEGLKKVADPIGVENDDYILHSAQEADVIICAWGDDADPDRVINVCELLKDHESKFNCLAINKSGMPRHPLYVSGDSQLIGWSVDNIKF